MPKLPAPPANLARLPIRSGLRGPRVRAWQQLLAAKGFALTVDGDFGRQTLNATRAAQSWAGVRADGLVGLVTWNAVARKQRTPRPVATVKALAGYPRVLDARNGAAGFPRHASRRWQARLARELKAVVGHHTGGPASFLADARFHVTSDYLTRGGAPALAYHLGVDLDGTLVVFNGWQWVTWHCDGGHNTDTLGLVARGNTDVTKLPVAQRKTLERVVAELLAGSFRPFRDEPAWPRIPILTTHRHVRPTGCPGQVGERFYRDAAGARFRTGL